jgi:hypothetical protein
MIQTLFFAFVVLLLFGIGFLLIIGTIKGWAPLVRAPNSWFSFFPYWFLKKLFGESAIAYYHIFIGIVFILGTIWLLIYVTVYFW